MGWGRVVMGTDTERRGHARLAVLWEVVSLRGMVRSASEICGLWGCAGGMDAVVGIVEVVMG